jgi:type I site-specific restriction endonuclease
VDLDDALIATTLPGGGGPVAGRSATRYNSGRSSDLSRSYEFAVAALGIGRRNRRRQVVTRDEFVGKMKSQLDEWSDEIAKLEAKFAQASDATKEELKPAMDKAREARDAVVAKLSALKNSSEASWESSRDEVERVWKVFKQSVNYFKSQL